MIRRVWERLRDWRRGYTEADFWSAVRKLSEHRKPFAIIPMTHAEMKATADPRLWYGSEDVKHG